VVCIYHGVQVFYDIRLLIITFYTLSYHFYLWRLWLTKYGIVWIDSVNFSKYSQHCSNVFGKAADELYNKSYSQILRNISKPIITACPHCGVLWRYILLSFQISSLRTSRHSSAASQLGRAGCLIQNLNLQGCSEFEQLPSRWSGRKVRVTPPLGSLPVYILNGQ